MNPKERFTNRAANYEKYRPSYPLECLKHLESELGMCGTSSVADIGSGTGIFSRLLAPRVARVFAVEPNADMRQTALKSDAAFANIKQVTGSAEQTTLPDRSQDLVCAAQAFHWFDRPQAMREFARILKPGGSIVLLWNSRRCDTPFMAGYESILRQYSRDYRSVYDLDRISAELPDLFRTDFLRRQFSNEQRLSKKALFGRLASTSYFPMEGQKNHDVVLDEFEKLFDRTRTGDEVVLAYDTFVYSGKP